MCRKSGRRDAAVRRDDLMALRDRVCGWLGHRRSDSSRLRCMEGEKVSERTDGGPAFPHLEMKPFPISEERWKELNYRGISVPSEVPVIHDGMSLRDWFAGQALGALIMRSRLNEDHIVAAYMIADAMLLERAK